MDDKYAIFVVGPELSGTRLWTKICIHAGYTQQWDTIDPVGDLIVWHRSFPHNKNWLGLMAMAGRVVDAGYTPYLLVTVREFQAMAFSQLRGGYVSTLEQAYAEIRQAYNLISRNFPYFDFTLVSYESLLLHPEETIKFAFSYLRIPFQWFDINELHLSDQNVKHYY